MPDLIRLVLASRELDPSALALLLKIRRRVETEGGECSASSPELGNAAGVCPRQAQRLIKNLQKRRVDRRRVDATPPLAPPRPRRGGRRVGAGAGSPQYPSNMLIPSPRQPPRHHHHEFPP